MKSEVRKRRLTLALVIAVPLICLAWLAWYAWQGSASRLLPPGGAAEWIRYPVPPQIAIVAEREARRAVFRRSFDLREVPPSARLRVRALTAGSVHLNDHLIELAAAGDRNQPLTSDVAGHLRAGTNELRVVVTNADGPPVLWLSLEGLGETVVSDERWTVSLDGAVETPACLAGETLPVRAGNPAADGNRTLDSLRDRWPTLLLFALLSAGVLLVGRAVARRQEPLRLFRYTLTPLGAALLAASLLWVVIFVVNTLFAPRYPFGFDYPWHLNYIEYIQQRHALPFADEGWEMYQPPLFYLLAACLLSACRLSAQDPSAFFVFRLLGLAIGLGQLALTAECLRLLFPDRLRPQVAGLTLAAFLPAPLYICHYITGDSLLMLLGTASVYVCLRVLRDDRPSPRWYALLGLCLGAALLTKISAVVPVGVVLLVLAGRLVVRRERLPAWAGSLGVTLAVTLLVSGWYYARVWARFGTPLVGNFGSLPAFRWWQDPGYGTLAYFFRFGRSLSEPFFSAFHGLPDGLYSTLWGDGLCAGSGTWANRPPWNYDLMAAGYLLALVPSLVIVVGLVRTVVQLVRQPRAEWFLILGLGSGLVVALLYHVLRYPYYCMANSRHLLVGAVVLCVLGAWGLDCLARLGRAPAIALALLVGTWAWTAYASFLIRPSGEVARNWAGIVLLSEDRPAQAAYQFQLAVEANPSSVPARLNESAMAVRRRDLKAARQLIEEVLRDHPDNPEALFGRAMFLRAEGHPDDAVAVLRRVGELAPDHSSCFSILGDVLMGQKRDQEAIAAYRQALRVVPSSPADHATLGLLLARTGQVEESVRQYRRALGLRPHHPEWLADLAWVLATGPDPKHRDPAEAVRLAEEACARTENHDPAALESLAAAQAATGRYRDALDTARKARLAAVDHKQAEFLPRIDEETRSYEKGQPVRSGKPPRTRPYLSVPPLGVDDPPG
jgi:tetratricopeptide (TPR) repeat protein